MRWILEARVDEGILGDFDLPEGRHAVIGRGADADWRIADEPVLSRRHVEVWAEGERLQVRRIPGSSNPVFYRGEARGEFSIGPGEHFVVGRTRFHAIAKQDAEALPDVRQTLAEAEVYGITPEAERLRLEVIFEFPEVLARLGRRDFFVHAARAVRTATGAAWTRIAALDPGGPRVLAEATPEHAPVDRAMSRVLVAAAGEEAPKPQIYFWRRRSEAVPQATLDAGMDWAICAVAAVSGGPPLLLYAAGAGGTESVVRQNGRFVGLAADMATRALTLRELAARHGYMGRQFPSPVIARVLESNDPDVLGPRGTDAAILRVTLRAAADDPDSLLRTQDDLRRTLTAITAWVFQEGGVVATSGAGGLTAAWNVPFAEPGCMDRAVRAAFGIAETAASGPWRGTLGLAWGPVIAGLTGSDQDRTYGVLGQVVEWSAWTEGVAHGMGVPLLATRKAVERLSPGVAEPVRVGRFRLPRGQAGIELYELVPPDRVDRVRNDLLGRGLEALEKSQWAAACELLGKLPEGDAIGRSLRARAEEFRRAPPKDWAGIVG